MSSSDPRVVLLIEVAVGVFGGLLVGAPVTIVIAPLLGLDLVGGTLLSTLAYPVGTALGVWIAARRLMGRGKLWQALVGAFIPAMLIAVLATNGMGQFAVLLAFASALLPPITAALALNRFSRPDPIDPYEDEDVDLLKYHDEGWEDD